MDKFNFHRTKLNVINNFLGLQKINRISYFQLFNKLRKYKIFSIKKNELLKKILCRKDNQYIYFALKFWENSQFKYYITIIKRIKIQLLLKIKNIKELSRTLQVLELLNEKLEDAYDNQKAILDNAKVMMFSMHENGLFKFFNPETVKLTGYTESEVISKKDPLLFIRKKEIQLCKEVQLGLYHYPLIL
jgi:PAS domain-containing protein